MYQPTHRAQARWAASLAAVLFAAACAESTTQPFQAPVEDIQAPALATLAVFQADQRSAAALPDWFSPQAYYANGSNVRTINGGYSSGCSINTGIAFDGTNLIMSCWYHNRFDILDTSDGHLITSIAVPGSFGYGAIAWDASTQTLWACSTDTHQTVVQIDLSTQTILSSFGGAPCTDGLAYDGSDNTLWTSGDVYQDINHWQTDGTLIANHYIGSNIGWGNSGIATGGANLYLANNGQSQIYEVPKDFSSYTFFAGFPRRIEDLECDDITFAPAHAVIWQQDAYDRIINAFEIPSGACPFGGGGGGNEDTTPPTIDLSLACAALWPPNHKMVTVAGAIGATDDTDPAPAVTVSVSSSEPENGLGDGDTGPDWAVTDNGDGTFSLGLRAERSGTGPGRVYTVTVTATDSSGNASTQVAACTVPHDKGK